MNKMIELVNNQTILPKIYINKNQITLCFLYKDIFSIEGKKSNLLNLIIIYNDENFVSKIILKL